VATIIHQIDKAKPRLIPKPQRKIDKI